MFFGYSKPTTDDNKQQPPAARCAAWCKRDDEQRRSLNFPRPSLCSCEFLERYWNKGRGLTHSLWSLLVVIVPLGSGIATCCTVQCDNSPCSSVLLCSMISLRSAAMPPFTTAYVTPLAGHPIPGGEPMGQTVHHYGEISAVATPPSPPQLPPPPMHVQQLIEQQMQEELRKDAKRAANRRSASTCRARKKVSAVVSSLIRRPDASPRLKFRAMNTLGCTDSFCADSR